jgi:hypothetical protein
MAPHFDSATSDNAAAAPPQPQGTEYHPAVAGGITSISGVQALHDAVGNLPSGEQLLPNADSGLPQSRQQAGFLSAGGMSADVSTDEMAGPQNTPLIGAVARPPLELGASDIQQDNSARLSEASTKTVTKDDDVKPLAAAAAPVAPSVTNVGEGDGANLTGYKVQPEGSTKKRNIKGQPPAGAASATAAGVAAVPLPEKAVEKAEHIEHKEEKDRDHIAHKAEKKLAKMYSKEEKKLHKLEKKAGHAHHSKPAVAAVHHHTEKEEKKKSVEHKSQAAPVPAKEDKHLQKTNDAAFGEQQKSSGFVAAPIAGGAVKDDEAAFAKNDKIAAAGTAATALPAAPIEQQREGDHAFGNEARLPEREQPHSANAVGDKPGQQPITVLPSGAFLRHGSGAQEADRFTQQQHDTATSATGPLSQDRTFASGGHHEPFGASKGDEKRDDAFKPKAAAAGAGSVAAVDARTHLATLREATKEDTDRRHIIDKEEKKLEKLEGKEEKDLAKLEKKEFKHDVQSDARHGPAGAAFIQKKDADVEKKPVSQAAFPEKAGEEKKTFDQPEGHMLSVAGLGNTDTSAMSPTPAREEGRWESEGGRTSSVGVAAGMTGARYGGDAGENAKLNDDDQFSGGAVNLSQREEPHSHLAPTAQRGAYAWALTPEPRTMPTSMLRTYADKKDAAGQLGSKLQQDRELRDTELQAEAGCASSGQQQLPGFASWAFKTDSGNNAGAADEDRMINEAALQGGAFKDFGNYSAPAASQGEGYETLNSPTGLMRTHEFHAGEADEHIDEPRTEALLEIQRRRMERLGGALKQRERGQTTFDDVPNMDSDADAGEAQGDAFSQQQQQQQFGGSGLGEQQSSTKIPRQDAGVFEASDTNSQTADAKKVLADAPALPGVEEVPAPEDKDLGAWRGDTIKTVVGEHAHDAGAKEQGEFMRG